MGSNMVSTKFQYKAFVFLLPNLDSIYLTAPAIYPLKRVKYEALLQIVFLHVCNS